MAELQAVRSALRRRADEAREAGGGDAALTAVLRSLGVPPRAEVEADPPPQPRGGRPEGEEEELCALVATQLLSASSFEPLDSAALLRALLASAAAPRLAQLGVSHASVCAALRSLDSALEVEEYTARGERRLMVLNADAPRLRARLRLLEPGPAEGLPAAAGAAGRARPSAPAAAVAGDSLESLLHATTFKERQARAEGAELAELLSRPTAREAAAAERFRSVGGPALKQFCPKLTREECRRATPRGAPACERLHFVRLTMPHTEVQLGDCSFLDTCRHMRTCKYVHYALDPVDAARGRAAGAAGAPLAAPGRPLHVPDALAAHPAAQWLSCDVRSFDLGLLGQFGVIMADPPWDIHMELPYGTMADDEMRGMAISGLQTDGLIFLWVTGRAMELGRECLALWGYRQLQELVWVKTNQLQRLIRTGRTGHWLNHSKEHCLVGIKGSPKHVNRHIDCDVLVAEVRETSRKPDEIYALLERLSPGTRKLEIFGRDHNTRPGWVTLGNQLPGVRLEEEGLRRRFLARYPERAGEVTTEEGYRTTQPPHSPREGR